jgi:hypothetical protein
MNDPTAEKESPAQFADRARLEKPNWSVGAKTDLLRKNPRNQARIFRAPAFEIEHETPEELAAMAAEAAEMEARNRRIDAEREAARRREIRMEDEWRNRRMRQAQADHRRNQARQARKEAILEAKHRAAVADAELKEFMLAAKRNPAADADSPEEVEAALATRLFDPANPPPPPVAILQLGNATVCTPGNLSNIQAPPKGGKSAVVGATLAAILNGNRQGQDTLGFSAENPDGKAVVHIDTEQSRFDHHALVSRALRRARIESAPPWLISASLADMSIPARRQALDLLVTKAAASFGGILAVMIDGVADLCCDPNDSAEAFALVAELHTLAIKHDCAVITVLHENPGTETGKTRGHLGSQLERKAETNLRLHKDANEVTTVWAEKARHGHIPKDAGSCFEWSDSQGMHVSCGTAREIKATAKRSKAEEEAARAFAGHGDMTHGELRDAIIDALAVAERTAKLRIQAWAAEGIISRGRDQKYSLA